MEKLIGKIKIVIGVLAVMVLFGVGQSVNAQVAGNLDQSFLLDKVHASNDGGDITSTAIQSDGKIIIAGYFSKYDGVARKSIARLNPDGSLDTSFDSGIGVNNDTKPVVVIQSDGKILLGGWFTSYNGMDVNKVARLNSDGSLDTSFNPAVGASDEVDSIDIQPADGKIIIGGYFASSNKTFIRLNLDGSLDVTFNAALYQLTPYIGSIDFVTIQSDGKIVFINGNNGIKRLNSDGSLDADFSYSAVSGNSPITAITTQLDGKIILATAKGVYRLNSNGSLDTSFDDGTGIEGNDSVMYYNIWSIVVQTTGKIIIGGQLNTAFNGVPINGIARLNDDGTSDIGFNCGSGLSGGMYSRISNIFIQSDEKMLIAGGFSVYDGIGRNNIARINADGSLDFSFNSNAGASGLVSDTVVQPDGKIIVGGDFVSYGDVHRGGIARLNVDGTVDMSFNPGSGSAYIYQWSPDDSRLVYGGVNAIAIAIEFDGKIFIGGRFTSYDGVNVNRIVRLNADGSLDTSFDAVSGGYDTINDITVQSDGKVIIAGSIPRSYGVYGSRLITRLNVDGSLDDSFNPGIGPINNSSWNYTDVNSVIVQPDGKIIIGGMFNRYNGTTINCIARLNADGSLDTSFVSVLGFGSYPNFPSVRSMIIQPDGKIIVGGNRLGGGVIRFNSDGYMDYSFSSGSGIGSSDWINAIKLQPDGKMVVGGSFTSYDGVSANNLARLNLDGSLDSSFVPGTGADKYIENISIQPDGKIIIGGGMNLYNGVLAAYIARLEGITDIVAPTIVTQSPSNITQNSALANANVISTGYENSSRSIEWGSISEAYTSSCSAGTGGAGAYSCSMTNLQPDTTYYYRAVATNSAGTSYGDEASFQTPAISYLANGPVHTTAIQSDGKIVIGGDFTAYNGIDISRIARLNTDGTLDTSFDPGTGLDAVTQSIIIQPDGKIIIAGSFTIFNSTTRNRIARLNPDGSLDAGFDPGAGADDSISAVAIQSNGKIIISGYLTNYDGTNVNGIARLDLDGSLDSSFNQGAGIEGGMIDHSGGDPYILDLAIQSDDKIVVGGYFTSYDGVYKDYITRLNVDGSLDTSFGYIDENSGQRGLNGRVSAIAIQADGKIVVGGTFTAYNGDWLINHIARLNSDGSIDMEFDRNPELGLFYDINTIATQSDGKIIVGGYFENNDDASHNNIARINVDGSLDTSFDSGAETDGEAYAIAVQSDGKIVIGGNFTMYHDENKNYITRINPNGATDVVFALENAPIVATDPVIDITSSSAIGQGSVVRTAGEDVERYIQWRTEGESYENDCYAGDGGPGDFSCDMTGLSPDTTYYVSAGIYDPVNDIDIYGNEVTFHTDPFVVTPGLSETIISHEFQNTGIAQGWNGDDDAWDYTLPFTYNFYGTDYSSIKISSNGYICLDSSYDCDSYEQALDDTSNGPIIAPLAMDLRTDNNPENNIFITENPDNVVIRWNATEYGETNDLNFEAMLYANGNIKFNYGPQSVELTYGAVVGISKGDGTTFTNSIYNTNTNFNQIDTSAWGDFSETPSTTPPTLTTSPTTSITQDTATGNANLTDTGGEDPQRIIEWGTATNTYPNSCTAGTGGAGTYSCNLTDLAPDTTYYIRASATNSAGTSYGQETTFHTAAPLPTSITIIDPDPTKMNSALASNYLSISSGASTATPRTTTNLNVTFQTSMASLTLPVNTEITRSDNGNFNLENFVTVDRTAIVKQTFPNTIAAVKVGVTDTKINFSNIATLSIDVDSRYNSASMYVFYQEDNESDWTSQTMCTIADGKCTFTTNHATTYVVKSDGSMAGETGINLNTDIQEVIALDCGSTTINLGNITPGTPITGISTCTATTNANGGYNLSVRRDDATSTLKKNTENSVIISDLTPWDPTTPNSNTWSGNGLGFTVFHSTANKNASWWGTGTTLTDSNNKYAGFNTTQSDIMRNSTYAATSTATDIGYMLNVPPTQKSGAYSGSVTYQAVTTP